MWGLHMNAIMLCTFSFLAAAMFPDRYNVVWDSPSHDSSGSMPLGNGDIGLNVWVEENGDLVFYIAKSDAWCENARLVKLGRIRVQCTPPLVVPGKPFKQTLDLRSGSILIEAAHTMRVWVDANRPMIRIEAESREPFDATARLEIWRTKPRKLKGEELSSAYGLAEGPGTVTVDPDVQVALPDRTVAWYHRNERSIWPDTMRLQGMDGWRPSGNDPLWHRTFGGALVSNPASEASATKHEWTVAIHAVQTGDVEEWYRQLDEPTTRARKTDWPAAWTAHEAWWHSFWERSWLDVDGAPDAATVSRGYALQRFVSACAGRGAYPIKFNGSLFNVDHGGGKKFDADFRAWGGPYWFQNTRLAYWPMLASGDFEMMPPFFNMFLDALPFAKARTQTYFGHAGAFFPETMYFWGAYTNDNYGWDRKNKCDGFVDNRYIRWHWEGQLELLAMMLDYFAYTQDEAFVREKLLPLAEPILAFFDMHFKRGADGKLRMDPAQALETWQDVVDPLPELAGLQIVMGGLLGLPERLTNDAQRTVWRRLRSELPTVPTREVVGNTVLAAAREIRDEVRNSENPELYAIFPFRLYGVGKPDLDLALRTFEVRRVKGNRGWQQDDTQAAFLGLAAEARRRVAERFATKDAGSRFPAFWGPNFDWIPDQDHGCNGLMALQTMLMQCEGRAIRLFPAWPKEWNVDFQLFAPFNTRVKGVYRDGHVESLEVAPPERRQDVVILDPQDPLK